MEIIIARRPTTSDVAREAGVSVTTVDRALNGRSKVRDDTMRKIAEAAHKVGYHARGRLEQNLDANTPAMTFGFLLSKRNQEFYQNLVREIENAVTARTDVRARTKVTFVSSQAPEDFVKGLEELSDCDAIAASSINHQRLTQSVADLKAKGVPVIAILNDFAQGVRHSYVGLNNLKIGRIAAWMITRSIPRPGKLAIFVGGVRWHGHDLREVGFRSFVRENAQTFKVLDALVNLETRRLTYEATLDLVQRHPDIKGIYVAGGGMEGAIAALRELHPTPKVALAVNEVTKESSAALADGYACMAITTPLSIVCAEIVEHLVLSVRQGEDGVGGQYFLDPHIVLPEML